MKRTPTTCLTSSIRKFRPVSIPSVITLLTHEHRPSFLNDFFYNLRTNSHRYIDFRNGPLCFRYPLSLFSSWDIHVRVFDAALFALTRLIDFRNVDNTFLFVFFLAFRFRLGDLLGSIPSKLISFQGGTPSSDGIQREITNSFEWTPVVFMRCNDLWLPPTAAAKRCSPLCL